MTKNFDEKGKFAKGNKLSKGNPKNLASPQWTKRLWRTRFEEVIQLSPEELKEIMGDDENPSTHPAWKAWIASIIYHGVKFGDHHRMEFLLNRVIGKVSERVEVDVPKPTIIVRRDGTKMELGAKRDDENVVEGEVVEKDG